MLYDSSSDEDGGDIVATYKPALAKERELQETKRNVMYQHQVDLVAGDFNGAASRRQPGSESRFISSIEETFVNTNLLAIATWLLLTIVGCRRWTG